MSQTKKNTNEQELREIIIALIEKGYLTQRQIETLKKRGSL